jgi:hypothetical protein
VHIKILEENCLLIAETLRPADSFQIVDDAMVALIDAAGDRLHMDI